MEEEIRQAAAAGDHKRLKSLIKAHPGAADGKDSSGRTALRMAVDHGRLEAARVLIDRAGADVNSVNAVDAAADGNSVLSAAAERGDAAMVRLLLRGGAEVDARQPDGTTALYWAVVKGRTRASRVLVEEGKAEVDVRDSNDRTVLCWAVRGGCVEVTFTPNVGTVELG